MNQHPTEIDPAAAALLEGLRGHLQPLSGDARRYDGLLALVGDARFVLLGEASHGTQEFYRERVEITKRLILEKRFTAVAVEADWPDAWRVNRCVRGLSNDRDATFTWPGSTPKPPNAPKRATPVSTTRRRTPRPTAAPPTSA